MPKIKVLYDYQIFYTQRFGGISRYFMALISGLKDVRCLLPIFSSENEYLGIKRSRKSFCFLPFGRGLFGDFVNKLYSLWTIFWGKYDVFHPTDTSLYYIKIQRKPLVLTIHDMIHELLLEKTDEVVKIIKNKKKLLERADRIIAISQNTQKDILNIYPHISKEKITVIYHGFLMKPFNNLNSTRIIPNRFLLFVGARLKYKNFRMMLRAITPTLINSDDLVLVCTGDEFLEDEIQFIESLGLDGKVLIVNGDDLVLANLYIQAELFIFPSIYEGFGFPILEAFNYKTPVCLSNTSCFPEIAGDAAMYFDPKDELDIRRAVEKVLNDKSLAKELIEKGKKRLELFSVDRMLSETFDVYKSVLEK